MEVDSVKERNECVGEKPKSPDEVISEEKSLAESKTEANEVVNEVISVSAENVVEDIVNAVNEGEVTLDDENLKSKEELVLHKSIESIPSESDGEDIAHPIEDDEEEEAAEESAYEEELIEDTDPEDQESENAVILSSDDDDEEEDDRLDRHVVEHMGDTSQEDEDYDDDYDDNDLMDSVILSSKNTPEKFKDHDSEKKKRKRSERGSTEERESDSKPSENRLDWRADLKKRLKSGYVLLNINFNRF